MHKQIPIVIQISCINRRNVVGVLYGNDEGELRARNNEFEADSRRG